MTKRILILTDPYGKPAYAPRLRYLCDYLTNNGYDIVVYTEQFQAHDFAHTYPIYEKPSYRNQLQWAIRSLWSLFTDWRNRSFSHWLQEQTKAQHFDFVFCTTFSTFPLRAAYEIAQKKHIPLFVDIRDLDEQVPDAQYQSHRQWWARPFRKWYQAVNIRRRNRVLYKADCITTVSPWHVDFLHQFNKNVHLIYNGFDPIQFYAEDVVSDSFLITYIGKIYEFQDISLVEQAIRELNLPDVQLNLHTPDHNTIPITSVGTELRKSSMAVVLTNPSAKGMMTTKFFEALGCEKPILCVPSDEGCLAQTMRDTHAGIATSDIGEIKAFILDKYHEWQQNGYTHQPVINKEQFSRQHQAEQFEQLFLSLPKEHSRPLLTDICWTLYRSNTTFDFLDSIIVAPRYRRMRHFFTTRFGKYSNLLLLKVFRIDLQRSLALRYIRHLDKDTLLDKARTFYNTYLEPRKNEEVFRILRERQIILASGTIDVIAQTVAEQLHPTAVHSSHILKHHLLDTYHDFDIITDNTADLPLIRKAHHAYIVVYNDLPRWQKLTKDLQNTEFIHANGTKY